MEEKEIIRLINRCFKEVGDYDLIYKYDVPEAVRSKLSVTNSFVDWKYLTCFDKKNRSKSTMIDFDDYMPMIYDNNIYRIKPKLYILFYNFLKKENVYKEFLNNIKSGSLIRYYLKKDVEINTVRDFVYNFIGTPIELIRYSFDWSDAPYGSRTIWLSMHAGWCNHLKNNIT